MQTSEVVTDLTALMSLGITYESVILLQYFVLILAAWLQVCSRKDLYQNISKCPEAVTSCEFDSIGCKYSGPRRDHGRHNEISMPYHMSLVAKHNSMERKDLRTKLENEVGKVREEVKGALNTVGVMNQVNAELVQKNIS